MKIFAVGCFVVLFVSTVSAGRAQENDKVAAPRPSPASTQILTPQPPRIDVAGAAQPVALRAVDVRVEIIGGFARTRVEMLFENPNARVLEGELQFPLLAGQAIDGFALDIDGELREAVPVEKAKGKQVFEDTIRRKVDPALLESTAGDNFRLRVYPLPAHGMRRVVVHYSESLDVIDGNFRYRLPVAYAARLAQFSLDVSVAGTPSRPNVTLPAELVGALTLEPKSTRYHGVIRRNDFIARGWLAIAIPDAGANARDSAAAQVQAFEDARYLLADMPASMRSSPRRIPTRIGIVWDSSASGAARDHGAEFLLLDAYFKAMGDGEVRLVSVRDVAETERVFRIRNGEWAELKRALQTTVYDGASDLTAWRFDADTPEVLVFSDGLANYGDSLAKTKLARSGARIFPVLAAASADRAVLRNLAQASSASMSAVLIDLTQDAAVATAALLQERSEITSIIAAGDADVHADADAWARGRLRLHGILRGDVPASLEVRLRDPDGAQRSMRIAIEGGNDRPVEGAGAPLAARLWARSRLDILEGDRWRQRAEIRRLGERFSLVTPETSLIVVDAVADYVRHDIMPPAGLRASFDALKQSRLRSEREQRATHIDRVAREYAEKIAWWGRSFPKSDRPNDPSKAKVSGQGGAIAEARDDAADSRHRGVAQEALASPAPASPVMRASAPAVATKTGAAADETTPPIGISLKKWSSDAPYIARFRDASSADLYAAYLDERADWKSSSAFYLDAADVLFERKQNDLALRVLSNLAEMDLENRQILRILGYRLLQAGKPQLAVPLFDQVRDLAPFEPQSFRDLGLALAATGAWQPAVDALYVVVAKPWDGRFAEVALIALSELNALVAAHPDAIDTAAFDPRVLHNLPVDLRVVLNWDADNSDMDLWVTDPNGERAYYGNRLTWQGGRMSADLTGGYGPEEFMLKVAKPGRYKVEANYYGNRQQLIASSVSLRLALITGFGRSDAKEQSVILRLGGRKESVLVGEFEVAGTP